MSGWKSKLLSVGERLTLIKANFYCYSEVKKALNMNILILFVFELGALKFRVCLVGLWL
jgi:hypothetical protein